MVYLIGPTGSGKTTLLRLLYMDMIPKSGYTRVGDYRSDTIKPKEIPFLRRSFGVVFQDFQLLPDRNVFDNVAFAMYATGKGGARVKNRVLQVLSRVGLSHKRRRFPHELSGGEQQRVVIARAIANEPWGLLADEPTGTLDPAVADETLKLIARLQQILGSEQLQLEIVIDELEAIKQKFGNERRTQIVPVEGEFTGPDVLSTIEGHVLDQARITGTYSLNPSL